MTRPCRLSRRAALASGIAASTLAGLGAAPAQVPTPPERGFVPFAAKMRALTGFDPLPRDLLSALHADLAGDRSVMASAMEDAGAPNAAQKRAIKALYHGILAPDPEAEGDAAKRLGFASALQWAAIEDSNNVISYCGGLPGFWAEPPRVET